jgi:DNA polymerase III subunit epsilon
MHDIAAFLRAHRPFDRLDDETLARVAESAEIELFAAHSPILASADAVAEFGYVVRCGSVDLVADGRLLDLVAEGELFGIASIVSGNPLGFVARAAEETLVYRIPADEMREVLERPHCVRAPHRCPSSASDRGKPRRPGALTVRRSPAWRNARFIAIDIETTGLDRRRDEVISFAGIPIEAGRIMISQAVHGLVRPRAASTGASAEIHGLHDHDLADAETAPDALASLAALINGRIPVVHAQWVERTFLRKAGCPLPRRIVDTAVLWRLLSLERGDRDPGICSLSAIAGALALPAHRPHTAEGDTLTAAQIFLAMATHLEARGHSTARALTTARRKLRVRMFWQAASAREGLKP